MCIVQKRDTGRLFAMKYVSRGACSGRGALGGVLKEVELLSTLEHPFLVNLWFSFQGNTLPSNLAHALGIHVTRWQTDAYTMIGTLLIEFCKRDMSVVM